MAREGVLIEIRRRKFTVDRPDMDPLAIAGVAKRLEERMLDLERATHTIDSSKLAIMAALDIACDMEKLQGRLDNADMGQERRLEEMIMVLEKALQPAKKP